MRTGDRILAVEAGGTKTLALLADPEGAELCRVTAGPGNFTTLGAEGVARLLEQILEQLGDEARGRIGAVSLAMAGCDSEADRKALREVVHTRGLRGRVTINNDARATLHGACGPVGVLVIAGTGSIAYGRNERGEERRAGGWGRTFGDEGSAYDLGRQALAATSRSLDGRLAESELSRRVLASLGVTRREDARAAMIALIDQVGPIARLAPLVVAAAREGDVTAARILEAGASSLVEMAHAVAAGLGLAGQPFQVAAYGGLLAHNPFYTQRFQQMLRLVLPQASAGLAPEDAGLRGALALGMHTGARDG